MFFPTDLSNLALKLEQSLLLMEKILAELKKTNELLTDIRNK